MANLFAIGMLLCLALFSGCGQDAERNPQSAEKATAKAAETHAESTAAPEPGGRLIESTIGEPSNLIPPLATDSASHEVASHIYVAPLKYDKDIELVPYAAESFETLDNGTLIKFKLREDIRWFDGNPVTAADVEFTYRLMIDPETPTAYAEDYLAVSEFKATGPYTFEVRYDKPFARALVTWAHDILPKHVLENENLLDTRYSRDPMGAGPYKLAEWRPGSLMVLEANPDYFEGPANIKKLVYRIIPDQATQFLELKARNLDMMTLSPQQYLFQTKGKWWEENYNKYEYLSFSYAFLGYNMRRDLFKDVRVRRAMTLAIDKREIVKGVLLGLGRPAVGPYKPGTWVYNDKLAPHGYDPAEAKALLAEAGWTDTDGDGLLDKGGKPLAFTILTNQGNDLRIKSATIIQERLAKIGVTVSIRTVEWAAFIKEFIDKGRFDAVILGWNILQDPDIYDVWHSSKAEPGGLNFTAYANAELDMLLERGRRTLDQAERKRIYDRIQEILHEDQPYTFLYVPMALPAVWSGVRGIQPAPAGITWNFTKWWIPKRLQRLQ